MKEKTLTFIVPIYNPDLTVFERCVKSLVDQSLKGWDAIFVLDGECPAARTIINRLMKKCPNSYQIVKQEHSGVQRARNLGYEHATGDYLVWWDCDCIIEPDTAKTWVEYFANHPEIGFIYSSYKFLNEMGAIQAEKFDPFTLRVRNYVSTCFPVRREFYPGWNENLKSLQDWDFWLSVVEKGGVGKYLEGYAFSTLFPVAKSISGQGCTNDVWLSRVNAVKEIHRLPDRKVCVSSLGSKHEGIWLAKLIDADYQDIPNAKPHSYKTIIQLGFSMVPGRVEHHSGIFAEEDVKKILFWTCNDVTEVLTRLNQVAIWKYAASLNDRVTQYVEDKSAYDNMRKAGFKVEILPLPLATSDALPLPEKKVVAIDCSENYNFMLELIQKSLPDVELKPIDQLVELKDISGLVHFHPDRTVSAGMKRALLAGRGVVSNVQAPFMGYVDDLASGDKFIYKTVEKIREIAYSGPPKSARDFYIDQVNPQKLKELINA